MHCHLFSPGIVGTIKRYIYISLEHNCRFPSLSWYRIEVRQSISSSGLDVSSHYILCVWGFLCLKWSYYLFQQSRHYTSSFHPDSEDAAPFVIQEVLPEEEEIS